MTEHHFEIWSLLVVNLMWKDIGLGVQEKEKNRWIERQEHFPPPPFSCYNLGQQVHHLERDTRQAGSVLELNKQSSFSGDMSGHFEEGGGEHHFEMGVHRECHHTL